MVFSKCLVSGPIRRKLQDDPQYPVYECTKITCLGTIKMLPNMPCMEYNLCCLASEFYCIWTMWDMVGHSQQLPITTINNKGCCKTKSIPWQSIVCHNKNIMSHPCGYWLDLHLSHIWYDLSCFSLGHSFMSSDFIKHFYLISYFNKSRNPYVSKVHGIIWYCKVLYAMVGVH